MCQWPSDTDAGADRDLAFQRYKGLASATPIRSGTVVTSSARDPVADDNELVATEAGEGVARAHGRLQSSGDVDQKRIASVVPQTVVDDLKRSRSKNITNTLPSRAARAHQSLLDPVGQQESVGQAGQRIMQSLMLLLPGHLRGLLNSQQR